MYNEEGDIIISEEEYIVIRRLKELKAAYRTDYDELKQLKSEVQYCQRLVDQSRQRLIQGLYVQYSWCWSLSFMHTHTDTQFL